MALNLQLVKQNIEGRTGLSCGDFGGDAAFNASVTSAVAEFSKYKKRELYGFFQVQRNVTNYSIPSNPAPVNPGDYGFPDNFRYVRDVYYSPQSIIGNNLSFEDMLIQTFQGSVVTLDFGGNIFENPSLVAIWFQ